MGTDVSSAGRDISIEGLDEPSAGPDIFAAGLNEPWSGQEVPATGREVPVWACIRGVILTGTGRIAPRAVIADPPASVGKRRRARGDVPVSSSMVPVLCLPYPVTFPQFSFSNPWNEYKL